jgi:hypothetical protein
MAFLGVGAGVAGVPMSNTVFMGPAVSSRVRSPPPVGGVAAAPSSAPNLGLGRKMVTEGFDLVGEGRVGGGKRGVRGNELLKDSLLVSGSTGEVVQVAVDGVQEAGVVGIVGG